MPDWCQGLAWREPGEPAMWRADELELIASPPVSQGALLLENPCAAGCVVGVAERFTGRARLPRSRHLGSRRRTR